MSQTLSPKKAHWILALFDVAALAGTWWAFFYQKEIYSLIYSGSVEIEYESSLFYVLLLLIVPVIHLLSVIKTGSSRRHQSFEHYKALLFGVSAIALIAGKYVIQYRVESALLDNGYILCEKKVKGRYQRETYRLGECNQ